MDQNSRRQREVDYGLKGIETRKMETQKLSENMVWHAGANYAPLFPVLCPVTTGKFICGNWQVIPITVCLFLWEPVYKHSTAHYLKASRGNMTGAIRDQQVQDALKKMTRCQRGKPRRGNGNKSPHNFSRSRRPIPPNISWNRNLKVHFKLCWCRKKRMCEV